MSWVAHYSRHILGYVAAIERLLKQNSLPIACGVVAEISSCDLAHAQILLKINHNKEVSPSPEPFV